MEGRKKEKRETDTFFSPFCIPDHSTSAFSRPPEVMRMCLSSLGWERKCLVPSFSQPYPCLSGQVCSKTPSGPLWVGVPTPGPSSPQRPPASHLPHLSTLSLIDPSVPTLLVTTCHQPHESCLGSFLSSLALLQSVLYPVASGLFIMEKSSVASHCTAQNPDSFSWPLWSLRL